MELIMMILMIQMIFVTLLCLENLQKYNKKEALLFPQNLTFYVNSQQVSSLLLQLNLKNEGEEDLKNLKQKRSPLKRKKYSVRIKSNQRLFKNRSRMMMKLL